MQWVIIILVKLDACNKNVYRFKINTNRFRIRYRVSDFKKCDCPILGLSAKEGILVLYKHPVKGVWTNIKTFNRSGTANIYLDQSVDNGKFYDVMLYSPLVAKMDEVNIEFGDRYEVVPLDKPDRSILVMGGQKSFGIGCTTAGTLFSNIIGRKFDSDIVNISYPEGNYLEKLNAYLLNHENKEQYDIGIIELDYLNDESIDELKQTVNAVKSRCKHVIGWYAFTCSDNYKIDGINEKLSDEINNGIIDVVDVSVIFNEERDMCSYDDKHINDAGNVLIYKKLSSVIKGVL